MATNPEKIVEKAESPAEPKRKTLFIVSQIGKPGSPERLQADTFREFIVEKAAVPREYECLRADDIDKSGSINQQIIEHLMEDDVVVADFTGYNGNVFYELAIRHASQKPFIHMTTLGQGAPSDLTGNRYIEYELNDVRSVYRAQEQLANQLEEIENGAVPESPFSFWAVSEALRKSGDDPEADRLDVMLATQQRLEAAIVRLERLSSNQGHSPSSYAPVPLGSPLSNTPFSSESVLLRAARQAVEDESLTDDERVRRIQHIEQERMSLFDKRRHLEERVHSASEAEAELIQREIYALRRRSARLSAEKKQIERLPTP